MDCVIVVLGILYLLGFKIGTVLTICSIIEGTLIFILSVYRKIHFKGKE